MKPQEIEKLFEGAPEGTTHYVEGSISPFEKREGDDWSFWAKWNNRWEVVSSSGDARIRESTFKIIPRPSPSWSGEGLPPVGVVCEVENEELGGWDAVDSILAHAIVFGGEVAVFQIGNRIAYGKNGSFRPIRTPEQIAADERASALHMAICDVEEKVAKWNTTIDCTAAIKATIDAMISIGYRKP